MTRYILLCQFNGSDKRCPLEVDANRVVGVLLVLIDNYCKTAVDRLVSMGHTPDACHRFVLPLGSLCDGDLERGGGLYILRAHRFVSATRSQTLRITDCWGCKNSKFDVARVRHATRGPTVTRCGGARWTANGRPLSAHDMWPPNGSR